MDSGFLPHTDPLESLCLSCSCFKAWEDIAGNLPELNKTLKIKEAIRNLPLLDHTKLDTVDEQRRAYSILSQMVHSYVWCDRKNPESRVPSQLAIPFYHIATGLGLPAVLTHAGVDLWDWKRKDNTKDVSYDNLDKLTTMTGTKDEKAFCLTMTAIEYVGASCLNNIVDLPYHVTHDNIGVVEDIMMNVIDALKKISREMGHLRDCDPAIFWNELRPYLNGWITPELPNGIYFEGINQYFKHYGGSAAQSSLIQVFDIMLHVEHEKHTHDYLIKMREYMPREHRGLIQKLETNFESIDLREYLLKKNSWSLYETCINELANFRKIHYNYVKNYILRFVSNSSEAKGTGGTHLEAFLTSCITNTEKRADFIEIKTEEEKKVYELLDSLNITYHTTYHQRLPAEPNSFWNCITNVNIINKLEEKTKSHMCRTLLIRDDINSRYYLTMYHRDGSIHFNKLQRELNSRLVRCATDEELKNMLHVTKDNISIFSLLNDEKKIVTPLIDRNLDECKSVSFHPTRNDATTTILYDDVMKFFRAYGYNIITLSAFDTIERKD
jgi:indoleamine 2,3-dioxygenase